MSTYYPGDKLEFVEVEKVKVKKRWRTVEEEQEVHRRYVIQENGKVIIDDSSSGPFEVIDNQDNKNIFFEVDPGSGDTKDFVLYVKRGGNRNVSRVALSDYEKINHGGANGRIRIWVTFLPLIILAISLEVALFNVVPSVLPNLLRVVDYLRSMFLPLLSVAVLLWVIWIVLEATSFSSNAQDVSNSSGRFWKIAGSVLLSLLGFVVLFCISTELLSLTSLLVPIVAIALFVFQFNKSLNSLESSAHQRSLELRKRDIGLLTSRFDFLEPTEIDQLVIWIDRNFLQKVNQPLDVELVDPEFREIARNAAREIPTFVSRLPLSSPLLSGGSQKNSLNPGRGKF